MTSIIFATIFILAGIAGMVFLCKNNRKFWGIISVSGAVIISVLIVFFSLLKDVKAGQAGIIVDSMNRTTRSATIGYNWISPFEKLEVINATVESLKYETNDSQNEFFGSQTSTGGYVTLIATVSARIDREHVDKYVLKHGTKSITDLRPYIREKLVNAIREVFTQYETSSLMKEGGAEASRKIRERLKADLLNDYILLENLTISDIEGDAAYEEAVKRNEQIRLEIITEELQKEKSQKEAENNLIIAEGKATADLAAAQGKAAADLEMAKGTAAAREAEAHGEAEAIKLINDALATNKEALSMKQIEAFIEFIKKWDGKLPIISSSDSIQMFGFDLNEYLKGTQSTSTTTP